MTAAPDLAIDTDRAMGDIEALAALTEPDHPYTRRVFSSCFSEGRAWLKTRFQDAGLRTWIDAGGNLIGRVDGTDASARPILVGSHSDTVPDGGRFDGIAGVVAGLEIARTLGDGGLRLRHPLEIIDFLGEEPSDFGVSCIGSRALTGHLDAEMLNRRDPDGRRLDDAIRSVGGDPTAIVANRPLHDGWHAALELHIEQGRVLEDEHLDVGVVTGIVGIRRYRVILEGQADHAGTTPMGSRHDALVGAAAVTQHVRDTATSLAAVEEHFVATVGRLTLLPNAANVVPSRVEMVLDVRYSRLGAGDQFRQQLEALLAEIEHRQDLRATLEQLVQSDAVACNAVIQNCLRTACASRGFRDRPMASGAGHDAMFLATMGPTGMLFVPSRGGRSHCPEEFTDPAALGHGIQVLCDAVVALDAMPERLD